MNIKRNVISNYIGQIYISLIGIIVYPFYLDYLGPEAYGLVGFFIVLQAWLQLLDMGMTPTIGRQIAYARGDGGSFFEFKKQLRSIEIIFVALALLFVIAVFVSKEWVANSWLKIDDLDLSQVTYVLSLIGVTISLRWVMSLYKSGINGLELQVWLNVFNIIFVSIRFLGALLLLHWFSIDYVIFFEFQLLISLFELVILISKFYISLPETGKVEIKIYYREIKAIFPFALSIGYTAGIWVLITQLDKLLLSKTLSLAEYGYFTIVAILSSGFLQLSAPIGNALMPRMTFLLASNQKDNMLILYRKATQLMAIFMLSLSGFIAVYADEVLYVWTGNSEVAEWASPILFWYIIGGGLASLVSFQYYLQYVFGNLKLFVLINTITAVIYIPVIMLVVFEYGPLGTGIVWFVLHSVGFVFVTYIVHKKFAPNLHSIWLMEDILPILCATLIGLFITANMNIAYDEHERLTSFIYLFLTGLCVLTVSMFGSSVARKTAAKLIFPRKKGFDK